MWEVQIGAVNMIGQERTARATFLPFLIRAEHEMIDDQLAAPIEEVGERLLALRTVEPIGLFDLDPG